MDGTKMTRFESVGGTESADRVADVLLLFAQSTRPSACHQIARTLTLSKAVVHRILQSLTSRSLLQVAAGGSTYVLGPAATTRRARRGARWTSGPSPRRSSEVARRHPRDHHALGARGQPPHLPRPVREPPGGEDGRRARASLPAPLRGLQPGDPRLPPPCFHRRGRAPAPRDPDGLRRGRLPGDLARIRERGTASPTTNATPGRPSIAASFFDAAGNVMGSISSSGPVFRYGE